MSSQLSELMDSRIMENLIRRALIVELLPTRFWPILDTPNLVNIILDLDRNAAVHVRLPNGGLRIQIFDGPPVTDVELCGITEHSRLEAGWGTDNCSTISGSTVRLSRIVTYGETSGLTIHVE